MPGPSDIGDLNTRDWQNLETLAECLEQAWQQGKSVDLAQFLPPPGAANRGAILRELIKTDLECRWRKGRGMLLEDYLEMYPEVGTSRTVAADLVFEEYRARRRFGDRPALDRYQRRFPEQFAEVELLAQSATWAAEGDDQPAAKAPKPSTGGGTIGKNMVLTQTGGYTLIERIGAGSFAEVWKASAPGGILKAIKIIIRPLDQAEAKRELEAMELIKNLYHPYLLAIHQYWPLEDRLVILMDLADGSLRDVFNQHKKAGKNTLPREDLLKYARQAAEALDYLHLKKVYHRDIKPENLLLKDGNLRVADFGLAKHLTTIRMATGTFAGTPPYMPPESWNDKVHYHSDQYSLAATFFELRAGRRLFKDVALPSLMHSHLHETPNLDPLGEAEQCAFLKALAKNPEDRYPSCAEFVEALEKAAVLDAPWTTPNRETGPVNPNAGTLMPDSGRKPSWLDQGTRTEPGFPSAAPVDRRSWMGRLVGGAVVLAFLGVAGWIILKPPPDPPQARIALEQPDPQTVFAGETGVPLDLILKRDHFAGPVQLTFHADGDLILAPTAEIPDDKTSVKVKLDVKDFAAAGVGQIKIEAHGDGVRAEPIVVQVTKNPLKTLPAKVTAGFFRPVPESGIVTMKMGDKTQKYYRHIDCVTGDHEVRFVLIPAKDKVPFYIMVDKVWNSLFAKFADGHPKELGGSRWRLGARLEDETDLEIKRGDLAHDKKGKLPVLRVDVLEAQRFAEWLGGYLPSDEEWDASAGKNEKHPGAGPYLPDWKKGEPGAIAIDRRKLGPMPVGTAAKDRSGLDPASWTDLSLQWSGNSNRYETCTDMAGNGQEWTRTFTKRGELLKHSDKVPPETSVWLRGRDFGDPDPLNFSDLLGAIPFFDSDRGDNHKSMLPAIGFRVVLKVGS